MVPAEMSAPEYRCGQLLMRLLRKKDLFVNANDATKTTNNLEEKFNEWIALQERTYRSRSIKNVRGKWKKKMYIYIVVWAARTWHPRWNVKRKQKALIFFLMRCCDANGKKLFNRIPRAAPKSMYLLGFRAPRNIYAFAILFATKLVIFINRGSSYLYGATV